MSLQTLTRRNQVRTLLHSEQHSNSLTNKLNVQTGLTGGKAKTGMTAGAKSASVAGHVGHKKDLPQQKVVSSGASKKAIGKRH